MVQDYAARFGIDKDMPPLLSMSLGAGENNINAVNRRLWDGGE